MTGGGSRYKTGSHIDVKGVGLTFGAVKALETDVGITHIGAFVEGASGHHHSHNRFDDLSVRGHGSTRYLGAGLLAKHDWDTDGQGGPYVEGSIRGGRLSMDWRTSDLSNTAGTVDYDSAAGYVAAHAGVGYTLPLTEKTSLDLSAKYFCTRLGIDLLDVLAIFSATFKSGENRLFVVGSSTNSTAPRSPTARTSPTIVESAFIPLNSLSNNSPILREFSTSPSFSMISIFFKATAAAVGCPLYVNP